MADALKVGPKIIPLFGYDIVIGKNSAFFSMECCPDLSDPSHEIKEI